MSAQVFRMVAVKFRLITMVLSILGCKYLSLGRLGKHVLLVSMIQRSAPMSCRAEVSVPTRMSPLNYPEKESHLFLGGQEAAASPDSTQLG